MDFRSVCTVWGLAVVLSACGASTTGGSSTTSTAKSAGTTSTNGTDLFANAMSGTHRPEHERRRDRFRHPAQTLSFFGLRPDMTVVEIWPGGGWYTAVLAPVLRENGQFIAATLDPADTSFRGRFARAFRERLARNPDVYDRVDVQVAFKDQQDFAEPNSVDLIVSFRSAHNWIRWPGHNANQYFQAIARALKPEGIFGIVQHRTLADAADAETGEIGYLSEALIIQLAAEAGLQLIDRSEINANPKDTRQHPHGVWSLPPTLRGGDTNRDQYLDVGESDRMTLKFQKVR